MSRKHDLVGTTSYRVNGCRNQTENEFTSRPAAKKRKAPPLGTCAATRKNGGSQWHPEKIIGCHLSNGKSSRYEKTGCQLFYPAFRF
jgi:hypothetical protein